MKEFLSRAGVSFTVREVDEDMAAYDELLQLGFRSVPVTVIGDQHVRGFDEKRLKQALDSITRPDSREPSR